MCESLNWERLNQNQYRSLECNFIFAECAKPQMYVLIKNDVETHQFFYIKEQHELKNVTTGVHSWVLLFTLVGILPIFPLCLHGSPAKASNHNVSLVESQSYSINLMACKSTCSDKIHTLTKHCKVFLLCYFITVRSAVFD